MEPKKQYSRILDLQVTKIMKTMETTNITICLFGLVLLILKAFLFAYNTKFLTMLDQIFTFLIISEVAITIVIKFWEIQTLIQFKDNISRLQKIRIIIFRIYCLFKNKWEVLHFLLIFIQPNIFFSQSVNWHMYNLSPLRVYTVVRFFIVNQFFLDPSYLNVSRIFQLKHVVFALRISYKKYFIPSFIILTSLVIIGFGNLMKDESVDIFQDIFVASYYIFTTISTVGYGDYIPDDMFSKFMTVIILISGSILMSFLTYTLTNQTKLNFHQQITYHQIKTLKHSKKTKQLFSKKTINLINTSLILQKLRQIQQNQISITYTGLQMTDSTNVDRSPPSFQQCLINLNRNQKQQINNNIQYKQTLKQFQDNNVISQLQQCDRNREHLKFDNPLKVLSFKHKLMKVENKLYIFSLINEMILKILDKRSESQQLTHFHTQKISYQ